MEWHRSSPHATDYLYAFRYTAYKHATRAGCTARGDSDYQVKCASHGSIKTTIEVDLMSLCLHSRSIYHVSP